MKFLQNLVNRLFNSWQTTLIGLLVIALTVMVYEKVITIQEWVLAVGSLVGLKELLAKDPDKVQNKNKDGEP